MSVAKLLLQAAAGNAGGASLDITDVFSTYLYTGNDSTQAINNGIDLDGEGGMVWLARVAGGVAGGIYDTERGIRKYVETYGTNAQGTSGAEAGLYVFNSNGFTLGTVWNTENNSGYNYVSWAFRKAPKFFDVVTYTGTGSAHTISHNLGVKPGFYLVRQTSGSGGSWYGYHSGLDSTYTNPSGMELNTTAAAYQANSSLWNLTFPTSTGFTVGTSTGVNASGETYVAYLFAHNDGDGEFGPDGDADIIKCGSYTGDGTNNGSKQINLGFEPQWLLVKPASSSGDWWIVDSMRGVVTGGNDQRLLPSSSDAEASSDYLSFTPTGFALDANFGLVNANGTKYIYMAIRRGPLAVPEDATEVFAVDAVNSSAPYFTSGFPVDMGFYKSIYESSWYVSSRITGLTEGEIDTNAAFGSATAAGYDNMTGFLAGDPGSNYYGWMWKRAPSYFDSVAFSGNGTAGRTVSHNLGVAPEMMWVKVRSIVEPWVIYHKGMNGGTTPEKYHMRFTSGAEAEDSDIWNNTAPTSSVFTTGGNDKVNANNQTYISYLFATAPGVSKVGSYTGNGASSRNIDCGFTSGSRFVMIKIVGATQGWFLLDSLRGIVSGDDPFLFLNSTAVQNLDKDVIDPYSGGFTVTLEVNFNGYNYIFYAIA